MIRRDVLDTRQLDKDIATAEKKKRNLIDNIAEGLLDRHAPTVAQKLQGIDDELLLLTTREQEVLKVAGGSLDPDAIAVQLIERVRDLAGFLESEGVKKQRDALLAFCKSITTDSASREIVIQADLTGLAQNQTPPGLAAGLCISNLPEEDSNL